MQVDQGATFSTVSLWTAILTKSAACFFRQAWLPADFSGLPVFVPPVSDLDTGLHACLTSVLTHWVTSPALLGFN